MRTVRRRRTLQHNVKAEIVWLVALVVCCIYRCEAVARIVFYTVDGGCDIGGGVVSLSDEVFIIRM